MRPLTSQPPSVLVARVEAANTSEPELGSRKADAEAQFARGDARQDLLLHRLLAVAQQHRAALPVGGRIGAGRRAVRQHLLDHDVAFEMRALMAAVLLRPGHADPALGADLAGEQPRGFDRGPLAVRAERAGLDLLPQEGAHLLAQFLALRRQLDRIEVKIVRHRLLPHVPCVTNGHNASAPRSATMWPSWIAQCVSLPNSSRQAHSRRVAWCSECS